jgi:hypothetical protein
MSKTVYNQDRAEMTWRRLLPLAGAALLLLTFAADARGSGLEDDLNNGRLGYKWVPDPPKRPLTQEEELGVEVAKYGGGGLIVVYVLRRMFSKE